MPRVPARLRAGTQQPEQSPGEVGLISVTGYADDPADHGTEQAIWPMREMEPVEPCRTLLIDGTLPISITACHRECYRPWLGWCQPKGTFRRWWTAYFG
jgi:hypothetical protein